MVLSVGRKRLDHAIIAEKIITQNENYVCQFSYLTNIAQLPRLGKSTGYGARRGSRWGFDGWQGESHQGGLTLYGVGVRSGSAVRVATIASKSKGFCSLGIEGSTG